MDMTQADRERLAARLTREERIRFSGVAKDAYIAAGVNSATWKRAVEAQTIKPHILVKIVLRLWPEAEGDWTRIPGLDPLDNEKLGREIDELREAVRAAREAGVTRDDLIGIVESETG